MNSAKRPIIGKVKIKIRSIARNWPAAILASAYRIIDPGSDKAIYLNIHLEERQNVYLLTALAETGLISCRPGKASLLLKLLSIRLFLRSVKIAWLYPSKGYAITDARMANTSNMKTININRNYYSSPKIPGGKIAPYFAHPVFYRQKLYKIAPALRGSNRHIKILFAGTNSRDTYSSKFGFPLLTRDVIIDFIASNFNKEITNGQINLVTTDDSRDVVNKFTLAPKEYLEKVALADFFICPPGWLMPHSHNMVEAMSVGTIPITNYAKYVKPALEPGTNCLSFNSTNELRDAIQKALNMSEENIGEMRKRVIHYYDTFLDPGSFGKELRRNIDSIDELIVNDESGK